MRGKENIHLPRVYSTSPELVDFGGGTEKRGVIFSRLKLGSANFLLYRAAVEMGGGTWAYCNGGQNRKKADCP
jgi:hypothetical protein